MSGDLLAYLSGRIPGGITLLPVFLAAFTFIWWFTWRHTGFWDIRSLWKVMLLEWTVLIALYTTAWTFNRPPPIPVRIVVTNEGSQGDWKAEGLADVIRSRLSSSPMPFVVQSAEFTPAITRQTPYAVNIDTLALSLKARWLIQVQSGDEADSTPLIQIKRRRSGRFKNYAEITPLGVSFPRDAARIAWELCQRLGDRSDLEHWHGQPPNLKDDRFELLYRATALRQQGEVDSAIAILDQLMESHPGWSRPAQELAATLLQHRPGSGSDTIYTALISALEADSTDAETYLLLGRYFLYFREWLEAESALKLAFNFDPDDPRVYFYLSRLTYLRLRDLPWKTKEELLQRALTLAPGYEEARLELAELQRKKLARQMAHSLLKEGLAIDPNSTALLLSLTATELAMSLNRDAADHCRRMLELKPGHPEALYNLGIALIWLEQYDEAIAILDSSFRVSGNVDVFYYKGVAYLKMQHWESAIRQFQLRMAYPESAEDMIAISARNTVKRIKKWVTDKDTSSSTIK